jgi:tetratricopeptide (TPR) repeat protein
MDLERKITFNATAFKCFHVLSTGLVSLLLSLTLPAFSQSHNSGRPELIRDTDAAEGKETAGDAATPKEPNPMLAEQNINIGDFYLKKKNYAAAIQRYLEAIEYQPSLIRAYEALARAYEKNGEPAKAINAYKDFIQKNPDSPKSVEFRTKLAKLEKKSN